MGKPKEKVKIEWSPDFAYAVGLLVTDGNLSPDGRHIHFTSKDKDMIDNFHRALGITNPVGMKSSGFSNKRVYYTQFSDIHFYQFLMKIGLMPNKSKRLKDIDLPKEYFFDFLRGHFDGDGSSTSFWDPRWKNSFLLYLSFTSASRSHLEWLRREIRSRIGISGHISSSKESKADSLRYAKKEAVVLLKKMYHSPGVICLKRKHLKIIRAFAIMRAQKNIARVV